MIGILAQSRVPGFARSDLGQSAGRPMGHSVGRPAGQAIGPSPKNTGPSSVPRFNASQLFGPQGGITSSNPATLNATMQGPLATFAPARPMVSMAPQAPLSVAPFPLPTTIPNTTGGPYTLPSGYQNPASTDIPWGMIAIAAAATVAAVVVFHVMTTPAKPERRSTRSSRSSEGTEAAAESAVEVASEAL